LRERVLARARAGRRPFSRLAAAAVIAAVAIGGSLVVQIRHLETRLAAATDTLALLRQPGTRVLAAPVTIAGRPEGHITIFAAAGSHRWLMACYGLKPNAAGETYQVWFETERGPRAAMLMPMSDVAPMLATLVLPADAGQVLGAAVSVEPRDGSVAPTGPVVFRVSL
jgi:hypothetical protein